MKGQAAPGHDQGSIDEAQNRRIATSALLSILAVLISASSFTLALWKHLGDNAREREGLYLRLEPDYRDYDTKWNSPAGPGSYSIDTQWILRLVNLSARAAAITSVRVVAYSDWGATIEQTSINREYLAYDATSVSLPMTLGPDASASLLLTVPVFMFSSDPELWDIIPPDRTVKITRLNDAVIRVSGFDIFGNPYSEVSGEHGVFYREVRQQADTQVIRVTVSTARNRTFVAEAAVSEHRGYQ